MPKQQRPLRFEYWKAKSAALITGTWYWHLKAPNGETIAQGEGYSSKKKCTDVYHLLFDVSRPPAQLIQLKEMEDETQTANPPHFEGHLNRSFP